MKLNDIYIKTYKQSPLDTQVESLNLLYRSGFLKYLEDGSYVYTILGNLFFKELENFIKEKFKDYKDISVSHTICNPENVFNNEIKSYKELPVKLAYKSFLKNDEYKFKDGLLNPKVDNVLNLIDIGNGEDIDFKIKTIKENVDQILSHLNIKFIKSDNKNYKTKYFYKTSYPLKEIISCENCGYNDYKIKAKSCPEKELSTEQIKEKEYIYTPNIGSIDELEKFLDISSTKLIKTLIFKCEEKIIAVLLRGDRALNINLLSEFLNLPKEKITMADEEDIKKATNAKVGFAGPIGIKVDKVLADEEVLYIKNAVVGANKTDYHIKNVNYNKDFTVDDIGNFKLASENEKCINCSSQLKLENGTSFIDIDVIKTKYTHLNSQGKEENLYNIKVKFYLDRLFSIIVEENKDEYGIKWPKDVSYFDYHVIIGNIKNENEVKVSLNIYNNLKDKGYNVLLDDRKERIGFKFKDSELIGIPKIIVVGKEIENNLIEVKDRIGNVSIKEDITTFTSLE
ncbi:prolyl-tRNA synthetase [Alkalithermobacter thermoalcaliphilus JW-YL-7 = DSM 7308]|uniref:Prolyl-tRNA synthetase n=1 Tax=Alkalithermobacter thermoalcaliphilus JW-YL-7 = DSM 7308 TaxID=1121328 RepID=A0A150FMT1_CLOPD|nr:YbaK/prolyl-tRNA synthetase associated region [[Clostridium] paradoxum JW-YL-7 = DSM 7308]SHL27276.1 prolyl-tRNA synthetase [[Clostridium] paradoxum JW-YL-7 = DSM 7308]